jgi:hypothetical protein
MSVGKLANQVGVPVAQSLDIAEAAAPGLVKNRACIDDGRSPASARETDAGLKRSGTQTTVSGAV